MELSLSQRFCSSRSACSSRRRGCFLFIGTAACMTRVRSNFFGELMSRRHMLRFAPSWDRAERISPGYGRAEVVHGNSITAFINASRGVRKLKASFRRTIGHRRRRSQRDLWSSRLLKNSNLASRTGRILYWRSSSLWFSSLTSPGVVRVLPIGCRSGGQFNLPD